MSLYEPEMCPQQVEPEPDGALIFFFSIPCMNIGNCG